MKKIKHFIKDNLIYILVVAITLFVSVYELPYYIEAPGSLVDTYNRISIDGEHKQEGSLNVTYVSQFKATPLFYLYSLINSKWDAVKPEKELSFFTPEEEIEFGKIMLKEANKYAIKVAYTKANLPVEKVSSEVAIAKVYKEANTNLQIGDYIRKVDGKTITTSKELEEAITSHKPGDTIKIEVVHGSKNETREATLIEYEGTTKIGVSSYELVDYTSKPECIFSYKNNESGSSGSLMNTLTIYNKLIEEDITKGYVISGTGSILEDGTVEEIAGVKYKILGAAKKKADVFIVPYGDNYDEAVKTKRKYNLNIDIIPVRTFDEAVESLEKYEKE